MALLVGAVPLWASMLPNALRIPIANPEVKRKKDVPAAEFSHWRHNQFQCYNCHPSIFPKALEGFTHDDMKAGNYCGACHNGRNAWAVKKRKCEVCHAPE